MVNEFILEVNSIRTPIEYKRAMNEELRDLNFQKLLKYPKGIAASDIRKGAFKCSAYCTKCEDDDLLKNREGTLFQMSHAAHTTDYEDMIGSKLMPKFDYPIMFLLESPGGDYGNGDSNIVGAKRPPVNHFYWVSEDMDKWPIHAVKGYGEYFAYLMYEFGLSNVYITNMVKCSYKEEGNPSFVPLKANDGILINCIDEFLKKEIELFKPKIIFSYGDRVTNAFEKNGLRSCGDFWLKKLWHPASFKNHERFVNHNNKIIEETLREVEIQLSLNRS